MNGRWWIDSKRKRERMCRGEDGWPSAHTRGWRTRMRVEGGGAVSVVINGLNWISVGRLIGDCRARRRRRTKLRTKLRREPGENADCTPRTIETDKWWYVVRRK